MTLFHQKLNQLTLTTMGRQLEQIASDAAAKNLSFAQALESLADLELESRNQNAIERRFRLSRLQSRHSIDSFNFKHHKSRMEIKARLARLLDLEFLDKGTSVDFDRQSRRRAKLSWPRSSDGVPAKPTSASCSPPPPTC